MEEKIEALFSHEEETVEMNQVLPLVMDDLLKELTLPNGFDQDDLGLFLNEINPPQEPTKDSIMSYYEECKKFLQDSLIVPEVEKDEEAEVFNLSPQFVADRLSDIQPVDGNHLSFSFTSLFVHEAEIVGIEAISTFLSLTTVSLKNNQISDPKPLEKLERLRKLNLNENRFNKFDVTLPLLEELELSQNEFRTVNPIVLPKLQKLNLSQNKICYITPNAFEGCPELKELDLSENKLKGFKKGVFLNSKVLKYLKLDQNQISEIHDYTFEGLQSLETLLIGENPLTKLDGLANLEALTKLDVRQAQFTKFEDIQCLSELKNLSAIIFDGTALTSFDTYRLDVILLFPWITQIDEDLVSFSEREEAMKLDIERKRIQEEERLERERERELEERSNEVSDEQKSEEIKPDDSNEDSGSGTFSSDYQTEGSEN